MDFNSVLFLLCFVPAVTGIHLVIRKKYRNAWLLFASLVFFGWSQPYYLKLIAFVTLINYLAALVMGRLKKRLRGFLLTAAVILNVLVLYHYKYLDFTIGTVNKLLKTEYPLRNILLPAGLSFLIFKCISYLADVYRGTIPAEHDLLNFAVYLAMFPSVMSGPIDRYGALRESLQGRDVTADDFAYGIERFVYGLAEKAVIANSLGVLVDSIWNNGSGSPAVSVAWLGSIAYSLQLYFDFAGYSNMAVGLGAMLGLHLSENFRLPYLSKSIAEFWRRWHITLGSWFRDYVYIPLGGNRRHVYINTAVVFLLTGIWHGAAWTFVFWGIFHGFFVICERRFRRKDKTTVKRPVQDLLSHLYVLAVVNFGWVLFRAPSVLDAVQYYKAMFGKVTGLPAEISLVWYLNRWNVFILILAVLFAFGLPQRADEILKGKLKEDVYVTLKHIFCLFLLVISVMRVISGTYNSFIYFGF